MQLVDRIFNVLELLSSNNEGFMITEISKSLNLPVSTTHRLLSSLKDNNYVVQDQSTSKYRLGLKVVTLASNYLNDNNIKQVAKPFMEDLAYKYGEVVFLTVFENERAICIDTAVSNTRINFYVKIGSEMPLNAAIGAQVILAYGDEREVDRILDKYSSRKYTQKTLLESKDIKIKLNRIKEKGYGICDEELELGVWAGAAPIMDISGKAVASITMLTIKNSNNDYESKIKSLIEVADKISNALGGK
ncbi:IclR family transcriptional regulator [uncultured Clostridium sp.]|uniref:IclR family transcriptional regulator n=1 Tax=uncultured Clostridium sp. TaxID=59620 RepID=UPI0028E1DFD9|nr:IclR family transcriptional regulator [uncultured Clostridium sp.]